MTWHDTLPWEDGEKYEKQLETERDRVAAADIAKLRLIKIDTKYGITYKQYRWWDGKYAALMCPMLQSELKQLCGKARIGRVIAPVEQAIDELGEVMTANGIGSPATHNDVQARRIGVAFGHHLKATRLLARLSNVRPEACGVVRSFVTGVYRAALGDQPAPESCKFTWVRLQSSGTTGGEYGPIYHKALDMHRDAEILLGRLEKAGGNPDLWEMLRIGVSAGAKS